MSFQKFGDTNKIKKVAQTDKTFEDLRKKIAEENNLIRCSNCNHLLSKKSSDGAIDLQHKHLQLIATKYV